MVTLTALVATVLAIPITLCAVVDVDAALALMLFAVELLPMVLLDTVRVVLPEPNEIPVILLLQVLSVDEAVIEATTFFCILIGPLALLLTIPKTAPLVLADALLLLTVIEPVLPLLALPITLPVTSPIFTAPLVAMMPVNVAGAVVTAELEAQLKLVILLF